MPVEGSVGAVVNSTGVVRSVDLPTDVFIDDTPFVVFTVESDGTVVIPVVNGC